MKKKRKYIYLEKCLIIRILQIYIFSFYDFLFFISLSNKASIVLSNKERLPIFSRHFGRSFVSGRNREAMPAARIIAFIHVTGLGWG